MSIALTAEVERLKALVEELAARVAALEAGKERTTLRLSKRG